MLISAHVLCAMFLLLMWVHQARAQAPLPQQKPTADDAVQIFNVLDFTASLLDFTGPPVPARKPAYTPRPLTIIEKLQKEAPEELSQKPLSKGDAEIYREVFALQAEADFKGADEKLEQLDDVRLLGHVLFQRYMHPKAYRSSFDELNTWLEYYNDHPGADRIYKLANTRKPGGAVAPARPQKSSGIARLDDPTMRAAKRYISSKRRTDEQVRGLNRLNREIYSLIRKGQPTTAMKKLDDQSDAVGLDTVEYDLLRGEISAGYLYNGNAKKAYELATQSVQRSGLHVPKAGWVAGLVAWRAEKYPQAAKFFEVVGRSPYASGWTASAGSYWAARSHMRLGNVKAVSTWLKRAMAQPRTFYGLVATRALGRDFDFNWKIPTFTAEYLDVLSVIPAANRAMALVAAGQEHLAEAELIRIRPENEKQRDALLAYAGYANLPGLAMRVANSTSAPEGTFYDAALYPTGHWRPKDGYTIDPALVHAIMRQESRFDPMAKSPRGAKGLMQLMPATAKSVAGRQDAALDNPETNLELGQRYLENLLKSSKVDGDLLSLLIAYNAGPGNLSKWKKRWARVDDSLLFMELVPASETRAYVERVLSNYWIYRLREGQPTPTLDAIAEGRTPLYALTKAL